MAKLLKYFRGYVRIRVGGSSTERFMNLCSNRGMVLWDIVKCGDDYCMNIHLKNFWEIRPIVKKAGVRVAVLERYGLPFFLPKAMKRKGFLLGMLLTLAFWIGSSLFIWDIELVGNYRITEDVFEDFLKNNQVWVGIRKESLDIEALEKEIRKEFSEVTWASAKLSGTKLQIHIKENDAPILVEQEVEVKGTDLVSEYSGIIVSMIVRSGVPKVSVGDVVEEGTVMVEGKIPIYNEDTTVREYVYVDADADIVVERVRNFSARLPFDYLKKEYTGREKKNYYFRWENEEVEIPIKTSFLVYDSVWQESQPKLFEKLSIPLFIGCITHREYVNVEHEYTLDEAEYFLNEKIIAFITSLEEKGVQIIEKDVKIDTNSNSWVVEAQFLVREPMGVSREIEKTEIGELIGDE